MKQSIELLYMLYAKELYRFIFSLCKDEYLSDDIVQTTFVEAIKSIEQFRGQSSVKTWLFSIAKHQCYQQLRKRKIHIDFEELEMTANENTEEAAISLIRSKTIFQHIDQMEEPDRSILILRIIGEYSFSEIGSVIGKSENYCRVIFYRRKQKLKKELVEVE